MSTDSRSAVWFKSNYSAAHGDCVEVSLLPVSPWHTASYSAERGECVEVSEGPTTRVRDTRHRELSALAFSSSEWHAFIDAAKDRHL